MIAQLLEYPDQRLREPVRPIAVTDPATMQVVQELLVTMRQTMHDHQGWGLSAPQLGVGVEVFIVHVPDETREPLVFINPSKPRPAEGSQLVRLSEGCLSFPGLRHPLERPDAVRCPHYDAAGRFVDELYTGWTARAIQHEYDHLVGTLLVDYLLPAARRMLDRQVQRRAAKVAGRAQRRAGAGVPA